MATTPAGEPRTAVVIRYGAHDQLPPKVSPVSVWRARSAPRARSRRCTIASCIDGRGPAWSNSSTGGAPAQHSPVFISSAFSLLASVDELRWMIQTWPRESTSTPIVEPKSQ